MTKVWRIYRLRHRQTRSRPGDTLIDFFDVLDLIAQTLVGSLASKFAIISRSSDLGELITNDTSRKIVILYIIYVP